MWVLAKQHCFKPYVDYKENLYKQMGFQPLMASVLAGRNIEPETIDMLLHSTGDLMHRSIDMAGCRKAGNAIADLVESKKHIYVFADYDVDGLMAGYIMTMFLRDIGADVEVYYPERKEGYGLSLNFIKTLQDNDAVITVDNGITAFEAIEYCEDNKIPLIVTDHHRPQRKITSCIVCDPYLDPNGYGHHLCGAAVAYKLCRYISNITGKGNALPYLPYAAIATVADVMPMVPENQALVYTGIKMINDGFAANIGAFTKALKINNLSSEEIAWSIAPRLNSCSRLNNVNLAKDFLYYQGTKKGLNDLMLKIDALDRSRKDLTNDIMKQVLKQDFSNDNICLVDITEYPVGLSGVVANQLMDNLGKPVIVYSRNKGSIWPGSVRSPFDILSLLKQEKELGHIYDCAGHANACGIKLLSDLDTFKNSVNKTIEKYLQSVSVTEEPTVTQVDAVISLSDITTKNLIESTLIPTDRNTFRLPRFVIPNVRVTDVHYSSNNSNNVCLSLVDSQGTLKDIWAWRQGHHYKQSGEPKTVDIIGTLSWGFGRDANNATMNVEEIWTSV